MPLTLRVTSAHAAALGSRATRSFFENGGTIGRGPSNSWVLPDPERLVSRQHAVIEYRDGSYFLTDTSSGGVYLNEAEEPVGHGAQARLSDGDVLRCGDYVLEVSLDATASVPEPPVMEPLAERPPWEREDPTFPQNTGPAPLTSGDAGQAGTQRDDEPFLTESLSLGGAGRIPEGWDPWADEPAGQEATLDQPDILARRDAPGQEPGPVAPFGPAAEPPPATAPPTPHAPAPPHAQSPSPSPAPRPSVHGIPDAVLVERFLAGAGLDGADLRGQISPEAMELMGTVLRELVQGLREVLLARMEFKSAFRMQQTTIRPVENNPLKFSIGGPEEALRNLFFPSSAAYTPPVEAVREGFQDIQAHHLGMMAGMQEALRSLVARLDPEALERDEKRKGGMGSLLAGGRKAQLWDAYEQQYQDIRGCLDDQFEEVFGNDFVRAYDRQIRAFIKQQKKLDGDG